MSEDARPYRSVLYIPGSKPRALEKAQGLPADAIIFDLEDAVAPGEKPEARALLAERLAAGGYGARAQLVRVNGFDTPWGEDDLAALAAARPRAVLLPKVDGPGDIAALAARLDALSGTAETRIWAMMETCAGVLAAREIAAASPRLAGFVLGTNDLAREMRALPRPDRLPLITALSQCLMAARAHGLVCVDGVYNAFQDEAGLRAECEQGRDLGFDGKTLIHPAQIATANAVFAPTEADLDLARRRISAYEEAVASGQGVAVLDGQIVENLHVETARALLAKAEAIRAMEDAQ